MDICKANAKYWSNGYNSPNVDSYVFRFYGRILEPEFHLPKENPRSFLVDFGCGQGAAVSYFSRLGFDCVGVDSNMKDIEQAKVNFPDLSDRFFLSPVDTCELPDLREFLGVTMHADVITSFQTLYYLPRKQFQFFLKLCHRLLKPGGVFFATMMSEKHELFFDNSRQVVDGDGWMREVRFETSRQVA